MTGHGGGFNGFNPTGFEAVEAIPPPFARLQWLHLKSSEAVEATYGRKPLWHAIANPRL